MAAQRVRARELGIVVGAYPTGPLNAITDVPGVEVGHTTVSWGGPDLPAGQGPARTGVTAIWPDRDNLLDNPVAAGFFALAGTGELTGRSVIEELGLVNTPILLTGTMNVGLVYDATLRYLIEHDPAFADSKSVTIPVVAECDDSSLHDARGAHVTYAHVYAALDDATGGPVAEGCVGGGTGMHCYQFKGGIGTSSRALPTEEGGWTVGVLVQTNFGRRPRLTIAGVPVGRHLPREEDARLGDAGEQGSGIIVVATNAPLDGRQLARVAKRASLGLGRTGSYGGNGSGELLMAFSTTYRPAMMEGRTLRAEVVEGNAIDPIFAATVDATEEAVYNALCMATTTTGRHGNTQHALPLDRLRELLEQYGRG